MIKKLIVCTGTLVALSVLTGCSVNDPTPELEEDMVIRTAEDIIAQLSEGDYACVGEQFSNTVRDTVIEAMLHEIEKKTDKLGELESFGDESIVTGNTNTTEVYVTAVIECKYEHGTVLFTICFDEEGWIYRICMI